MVIFHSYVNVYQRVMFDVLFGWIHTSNLPEEVIIKCHRVLISYLIIISAFLVIIQVYTAVSHVYPIWISSNSLVSSPIGGWCPPSCKLVHQFHELLNKPH